MPYPNYAQVRADETDRSAFEGLLDQSIRTWSIAPMLIIYPAGCISGQVRLFVETDQPLGAAQLKKLVRNWDSWSWQVRYKQDNREIHGQGPSALLDSLIGRLRSELVTSDSEDALSTELKQELTLINVMGTLHDAETGKRHKEAQRWMTQLAGVEYAQAKVATLWGERYDEAAPWIIRGRDRIAIAVDDAAHAHLQRRRKAGGILEARRALRNRAISSLEMGLAASALYRVYDEWLTGELQAWEMRPLQGRWSHLRSSMAEPTMTGRIYGTLFYELAYVEENLRQADPHNREMWQALFLAAMDGADQEQDALKAVMARVATNARLLYDQKNMQRQFMAGRVEKAVEMIMALAGLLGSMGGA